MKLKTTSLILAGAIAISIAITATAFFIFPPYETRELGMYLRVSDYIGFNVSTAAITFGTIPPGGAGERNIVVDNFASGPRQVIIRAEGELAKWVFMGEKRFLIQGNESKTISIFVHVPADAEFGNYMGTLKILFFPA